MIKRFGSKIIMPSFRIKILLSLVTITMHLITVHASPEDLQKMLGKIEEDTYTFAHKMEELILNKCNFTSDETCYRASYDSCDSELPFAQCPGDEYSIKECGSQNSGCGGLFDFTTSIVRIPDTSSDVPLDYYESELKNDRIRDSVCSTLRLEEYMKNVTETSKPYWESFGVFPPWLYYGTNDG